MKVGDLLIAKKIENGQPRATLLVVEIKEHPSNSERDKICLQWMPNNTNTLTSKGEYSRLIVEKNYRVLSDG